jgi:hypothetical protein
MLFRDKMQKELDAKSSEFRDFLAGLFTDVSYYSDTMSQLEAASYAELEQRLAGEANIGAMPAMEVGSCKSFAQVFDVEWKNHEQARNWALNVLDGRTTFAADGSQIYAAKKTSVPVAAIQVGWFENPHDESKPYSKGSSFEILTPEDLFRDQEDPMNPDIRVEERRYLGEVARIGEFLQERRGWKERGEPMPLAFFDNPLLVPFSQKGTAKQFSAGDGRPGEAFARNASAARGLCRPELFARPDLAARPLRRACGRASVRALRCGIIIQIEQVAVGQPNLFFLFETPRPAGFRRSGDRRFQRRVLLSADDSGRSAGETGRPELGL